jgi:deazaflavin-dependent oxidoreductase (nitroreductase family)
MRIKVPVIVPLLNPLVGRLLGLGLPMGPRRTPMVLLTIKGRKSGELRTTPVNVFHRGDRHYVFGTFGETNWVRNLRAAGEAILTERGQRVPVEAVELSVEDGAPVLRELLEPLLRTPVAAKVLPRFYRVTLGAPLAAYVAEARRHPIFELRPRRVA